MKKLQALIILVLGSLYACQPEVLPTATSTPLPETSITSTSTVTSTAYLTRTPQLRLPVNDYGPELEDFPSGYNPLTGQPVDDPSMLNLPAVLVSISNMPVTARPQAGLSFAPWVFELFIGEGSTRFMSVFYGDYPRFIPNVSGDCPIREERFNPDGDWIGNRVWLDENSDGRQNAWEVGVGGICVLLYRNGDYEHFWTTGTDSNGYYAINLPKNDTGKPLPGDYALRFEIPPSYSFTDANIGDDDHDSDADPTRWATPILPSSSDDASWDAGLCSCSRNRLPPPARS